jgi:hypothetical protein
MARIPSASDMGLAETVRRTVLQKRANASYGPASVLLAAHEKQHAARMAKILARSPRPPLAKAG